VPQTAPVPQAPLAPQAAAPAPQVPVAPQAAAPAPQAPQAAELPPEHAEAIREAEAMLAAAAAATPQKKARTFLGMPVSRADARAQQDEAGE
jgi:hypothetical protein